VIAELAWTGREVWSLRQHCSDDPVHRGPLAGQELIEHRLSEQRVPEPARRRCPVDVQDSTVDRRMQCAKQLLGWVA
jgi:hypothetical protein